VIRTYALRWNYNQLLHLNKSELRLTLEPSSPVDGVPYVWAISNNIGRGRYSYPISSVNEKKGEMYFKTPVPSSSSSSSIPLVFVINPSPSSSSSSSSSSEDSSSNSSKIACLHISPGLVVNTELTVPLLLRIVEYLVLDLRNPVLGYTTSHQLNPRVPSLNSLPIRLFQLLIPF
jgi:hypothetical protein